MRMLRNLQDGSPLPPLRLLLNQAVKIEKGKRIEKMRIIPCEEGTRISNYRHQWIPVDKEYRCLNCGKMPSEAGYSKSKDKIPEKIRPFSIQPRVKDEAVKLHAQPVSQATHEST